MDTFRHPRPSMKLFYRELIDCGIIVLFTGIENDIRKVLMVYGVVHLLSLKTEGCLKILRISALEGILGAIEEVARIELHAGLVGKDLHYATAVGLVSFYAKHRLLGLAAHKAEAMVKAACQSDIGILQIKIFTDGFG